MTLDEILKEIQEAEKIVNIFKPLYESEEILKIGQNMKYDIEVLANYGVEVRGKMFDTMIAHYLIQPELRHNMDYMAEIYLDYQTIHIEELIGPKGRGQKNMRDLTPEQLSFRKLASCGPPSYRSIQMISCPLSSFHVSQKSDTSSPVV